MNLIHAMALWRVYSIGLWLHITKNIVGIKVDIKLDLETFYLNERTTIQCSAGDFSQIELIQLRINEGETDQRTGCLKGAGEWVGDDNIFNEDLISSSACNTTVQSTPAIINLQPTITEQLRGASLFCYAYDAATSAEKQTTSVVVDNIRGELIDSLCTPSKSCGSSQ